jgi:NADH dehydrogenase/NADH:ubiquinone oxidoreductase subunit G
MLVLVPWWAWLAALAAAGGGATAWHLGEVHGAREAGQAQVQALWDAERARQTEAALKATEAARLEEQRRAAAQQEIADVADRKIAAAVDALARADAAADRLRHRAAALAASCRGAAADPAAASAGQAASSPGNMLADVQRQLVEAAGLYASVADARGIAGAACERAYQSLTVER